jgi:hypothetical protein
VVIGLAACNGQSKDLACNQPTKLLEATASIPRLAAAASGSQIVVGWTADDATLGSARIKLDGSQVESAQGSAFDVPGSFTGVSLAMTDSTTLVALGQQDGHTQLVIDGRAPIDTTVQLLAPDAAIATGDTPDFMLAGNDSASGSGAVIGISADGTLTPPVVTGAIVSRLVSTRIDGGLAAVEVQGSNSCALVPIDSTVTHAGTAIPFGAGGRCTQADATFVDDTTSTLLVFRDDSGAVKAAVMKSDRTLGSPMTIASSASEPRVAATSAGTWVSYTTNGMLEATLVDDTGAPGTTVVLGPIGDPTSQTVVSAGGTAYALWLDGDLEIARLCPAGPSA